MLKPGIGADYFSRRSRKGAWIEILADQTFAEECDVAPVRERGLKSVSCEILKTRNVSLP